MFSSKGQGYQVATFPCTDAGGDRFFVYVFFLIFLVGATKPKAGAAI